MTDARSEYRIEHDAIGEVKVPKDVLFGGQTQRALTNFPISGRTGHPELIRAYLRIKLAAARANSNLKAIGELEGELIIQAAEKVLAKLEESSPNSTDFFFADLFPIDPYQAGAGTSQNMNINEVLANVANGIAGKAPGTYTPVHPNDHVNRSQSTNDTFPTAMRLALIECSGFFVTELFALSRAFGAKVPEGLTLPKAGRTHLQDAVPITVGQEFGAYAHTLERLAGWMTDARIGLGEIGIGGGAVGTGLTVPAGFGALMVSELSRLTGVKLRLAPNLCEFIQSQAVVAFYGSILKLCALEMTRICNDLRLLASGPFTGLMEITLPAVQPGSSIMPGKVNPSVLEMANQTFFSILGYEHASSMALQAGQLELNVMMPVMAYSLLEATHIGRNALMTLRTRCVEGIRFNQEKMIANFETTPQVATALSPKLGYERTAALVSESLKTGKSVLSLVRENKLISDEDLSRLVDWRELVGLGK